MRANNGAVVKRHKKCRQGFGILNSTKIQLEKEHRWIFWSALGTQVDFFPHSEYKIFTICVRD